MNQTILSLTLHGLSFFAVSPREARAMALRAIELLEPGADEADLVELYSLIWRANRDAGVIRDGAHNMPVHHLIDSPLPADYLIEPQPRGGAYAHLYREQPHHPLGEYEVQLPEWRRAELEDQLLAEGHHAHQHHEEPAGSDSTPLTGQHHAT